ncbi:MAG TPA: type 1 glutamine amidotransferase [Mycobacteriales bacterium]|nr:type 1 glutamine amidotransferase [Mycobacteriales bacterium]
MRLPTLLVVQHSPTESLARLGGWLSGAGMLLDVRTPYDGSALPGLGGFAGVVVMGGSMGAYDDADAPWLPATRDLLRDAVGHGVPVLGVCLGGQLLAGALGGQVKPGDQGPEIGPALVAKRDVAAGDPLFGPIPFTPDVLQWHWDEIVTLPEGAVLLASSPRYANQAFRYGESAWGLQFHIETTAGMVRAWAAEDRDRLEAEGWDLDAALAGWDLDALDADLEEVWQPFAVRFAEVARRFSAARPG